MQTRTVRAEFLFDVCYVDKVLRCVPASDGLCGNSRIYDIYGHSCCLLSDSDDVVAVGCFAGEAINLPFALDIECAAKTWRLKWRGHCDVPAFSLAMHRYLD